MTYRSRYLTTPMLPPVIDLLLLDETNPRSVAFQIAAIVDHVEQLPRDTDESVRRNSVWCSLAHRGAPRRNSRACEEDSEGRRGALEALLQTIGTGVPHLSELITRRYFSHAEPRRPADLR